jgi:hypothetical protein
VDVIVAQVIPYRRGPEPGHRTYNAAIPGIVAPRGARVSMVDMQTLLSPSDYADGFHPNAGGYDKMARAWEPVRPRALDGVDQADHAPAGRDTARCAGSR